MSGSTLFIWLGHEFFMWYLYDNNNDADVDIPTAVQLKIVYA